MKFISEYRDPHAVKTGIERILQIATRKWTIMEICGGQTHALLQYGMDQLLEEKINLLHGPGCPVCVTPLNMIDKAIALAQLPDAIFTSFGDMLRVPGSTQDLISVKARGADIRIVYSPMDTLELAKQNPDKQIIFFAVGFETTAPAVAMAVWQAYEQNIPNLSFLVSHVRVPPAIELLLSSPHNTIQGFLAAGHVCTVMGYHEYEPIVKKFKIPIVVTGFEPVDLLQGIYLCVKQLERGQSKIENPYSRSVSREGNTSARELMQRIFKITDRDWRGIGTIQNSGLELELDFQHLDAERRFQINTEPVTEPDICISGLVLQGTHKPDQCPAFGTECTPDHPLGATMVSSEGACAAYYHYRNTVVNT